MSMTWKLAMPLLSTLAALVIIVHSAEEDRESEYRHELRPRILDTGTPSYNQPWRVVNGEPVMQKSPETDTWTDNSDEDPPKRRRPGRKRKRRPQTSPGEGPISRENHEYPEESRRPYYDVNSDIVPQTTDMPRRRRKKIDSRPNRWIDEHLDHERPLQRRGQRKKRPSLENWPRLSEFSGYRRDETPLEVITESTGTDDDGKLPELSIEKETENGDEFKDQKIVSNIESELGTPRQEQDSQFELTPQDNDENIYYNRPHLQEDKSLSEFSFEVLTRVQESNVDKETKTERGKLKDKSHGALNEYEKAQDKFISRDFGNTYMKNLLSQLQSDTISEANLTLKHNRTEVKAAEKITKSIEANKIMIDNRRKSADILEKSDSKVYEDKLTLEELDFLRDDIYVMDNSFIDPITLKDILKRSNGTSLSEILQQHNLSLTDLLHGKENAISLLKFESAPKSIQESSKLQDLALGKPRDDKITHESDERVFNLAKKGQKDPDNDYATTTQSTIAIQVSNMNENIVMSTTTEKQDENTHKVVARRQFPPGIRRKLRMKPTANTTYKSQLSRDLIALNARKYLQHRRNITKSKEWKNVIPSMSGNTTEYSQQKKEIETTTVNISTEEAMTTQPIESNQPDIGLDTSDIDNAHDMETKNSEVIINTTTLTKDVVIQSPVKVTEKPIVISIAKHPVDASGLRRQAFNNRLKKKRLRQKSSTTEYPPEEIVQNIFATSESVSSTDTIANTQEPIEISNDDKDFITALEDFMTTQIPSKVESITPSRHPISRKSTTPKATNMQSSTEETAIFEIEEIFNDTKTGERLSKILMERNMTLSELAEHRERGSSHVHLADIFHNASKEPNPPEPFLSKSLIEPISRETYPLRAILEANLHDSTAKATTIDTNIMEPNYASIPVIMDFGNNVNENAENMGIMSLFNNYTKSDKIILKDSEGRPYKTDIIIVNNTQLNDTREKARESRVLTTNRQDDVVSWNEIFSLMRRDYNNETKELLDGFKQELSSDPPTKITLEEDIDGDGLIVLEDLQHLKDFDSNIASESDEKLEVNISGRTEAPTPGILQKIPSQTKSVTVATASIAGLALVLFLLTYAAFKWKQQRVGNSKKPNTGDERIPSPVFENMKSHRTNSSTRSMSPMLTSNIYTLNTLDSRNGKESPDYMWDTLRKPFQ